MRRPDGLLDLADNATLLLDKGEEGREGKQAYFEKRKPDFTTVITVGHVFGDVSLVMVSSKDSRDHIDFIISKLTEEDDGFRILHSRGYVVDLCVRWDSLSGHGGPTLSPNQMSRLSALDIEVLFDIYFHGDDFACEGQNPPPKPPTGEQDAPSDGDKYPV